MSLVAIGMNHKTASLDIREKFSLDKDESHKILKKLHSMPIIEEVFLLSLAIERRFTVRLETCDM